MTDRDHFAAFDPADVPATGWAKSAKVNLRDWVLGQGEFSPENTAKSYQRVADEMAKKITDAMAKAIAAALEENTDLDAAPAAKARVDSATGEPGGGHGSGWTDKPVTRPVLGTGDTQEPVAWAAECPGPSADSGPIMLFGYTSQLVNSLALARGEVVAPFPLYRTPQTCPHVVGRTTRHCSLTPLSHKERAELQSEIDSLRLAIRRLADQDATLSVCDGSVTVTIDGTLTDEEREAIRHFGEARHAFACPHAATLRGLLERTK